MGLFNNILSWISNPVGSLMSDRSKRGNTIWNNPQSENYKVDSLTESGNEFAGTGMDPNGFVSGLWNDLTGVTSQSREFAQQEYLMDKQNAYNHPAAQMARMKEAGINPNTAATGIAQGGNESAQAPAVASNEQGVAQGIGQAAAAVSGLGSLPATISNLLADTAAKEAAANETNQLLTLKGGLLRAQMFDSFTHAGLNFHQATAFEIENEYRGIGLCLDIAAKRAQLPILRQTFRNLQAEYDVKMKSIDVMDQEIRESNSRISLNEGLALQARKNAAFIEANTWYQNRINETYQTFNFDPRWGTNSVLFGIGTDLSLTDKEAEERFDAILKCAYSASFNESKGSAEGSFEIEKGLIHEQEKVQRGLNRQKFGQDMANKWIRVPNSAGVGPFSMSTE